MNEKRVKVLYLITKSSWGGAQRYVYDLATNLPSGYEVVVALGGGNGILKEKLEDAGVRTLPIRHLDRDISASKELGTVREIAHIITSEQPDILHVNSSKAGGIGAFLGRVYRVPHVVFTAHGWAFNEDRPRWQKVVIAFLHWLTIMLAHTTIAVSTGLKAQMRWPLARRKMVVINPGRDPEELLPRDESRTELAEKLDLSTSDGLWIGTIAELHPIKRLRYSVDAVARLKDSFPTLRYIIIGEGELKDDLTAYANEQGLSDTVLFTGMIPNAAMLLPAFDIFCLPSKSESYGYVLLEAGHASLPIVATNTGGITDIITDKKNGLLVPTDDPTALTEALGRLLASREERRAFGAALQKTAHSRTVNTMVAETCVVYNKQ